MNRKALERVRDRLRNLPDGVEFDQTDEVFSCEETKLCCCTAGVAMLELKFRGDVIEARRAAAANGSADGVITFAAQSFGFSPDEDEEDRKRSGLFETLDAPATAQDAAAAIQEILDDPDCEDPWGIVLDRKSKERA